MKRTFALLVSVALVSCGENSQIAPEAEETEVPEELRSAEVATPVDGDEQTGTPMAERVATIGVLNKRNNVAQDLEMRPGEARRLGDLIVRLSACERTPSWEMPRQTGAFVQVLVENKEEEDSWLRIFSGWMFKESPSINVVEHPIYDVWVKDCAMSFPGEDTPPASTPAPSVPQPEPTPETNDA